MAARSSGRYVKSFFILLAIVLVGLVAWRVMGAKKAGSRGRFAGQPTAQAVRTAVIKTGDIRVMLDALGTVTPLATVTVKTQIAGQLMQLGFTEGQIVKKGAFLAEIDPRPYQVALEQAEGELERDQASLADARLDLKRYLLLQSQNSIARQEVDTQRALVQQYEGTVRYDQGLVDSAKLNLTYCHVTAPVGGRVGLRQVDQGNYVQTSDTDGLVVITQLEPISVVFSLPEDDIDRVVSHIGGAAPLAVTALDRTATTTLATGTLTALDNEVDTTTGTVKLRATFANSDDKLFPNQFVNARLLLETLKSVVTVPTAAVQNGAPGAYVYVVNADGTVSVRTIKEGPVDGAYAAVTSGLKAGDQVVVDGADRLRDGAKVTVVTDQPATSADQTGAPGAAGSGQSADPAGTSGQKQNKGKHRRHSGSGQQQEPSQQQQPQ